jgi:hypothetical protein
MGQHKETEIGRVPLLDWYWGQFREMVGQRDARLMIIGYSFRDQHINEVIEAAAQRGTQLFIIDPLGVDVVDNAPNVTRSVGTLKDRIRANIIGASRRQFLSGFTENRIELAKIMRFFTVVPS